MYTNNNVASMVARQIIALSKYYFKNPIFVLSLIERVRSVSLG